jgi:Flp pilus assembly protein TadG
MRKLKAFLKCERGTQLIEFAIALPFLILLFASATEMGRMFYTYTTLQKSTEVGARYLSTVLAQPNGTYASANTTAAQNLVVCGKAASCSGQTLIAKNLAAANVTITPPGNGSGTRYVTVKVTYAYQPLVFNLANRTGIAALSLNYTFTPVITMRYMP